MSESNNLVYYRKYRPQKFDDVVGQNNTVRILKNAISKKRLAHAYLFSGPRGTGKTTVARILSREAGCFDEDIVEIDAASSRGIDEARALRESVWVLPLRSPYKVYIIDEVHMLTREAFNALLKTLEEPPQHTIFILATTELQKVPDTIISRTQHFDFMRIPIPEIVSELKKISFKESIGITDEALKLIAFFAEGSLRDAENILFQVASMGEKMVEEEVVRALLGAPEEEAVNQIIKFSLEKNVSGTLKTLDEILERGAAPELLLRLLLRNFRAIYFLALDAKNEDILRHEFADDEIKTFHALRGNASRDVLELAVREVLNAFLSPADDSTAHMPMELALIKISTYEKK